MNTEIPKCPFCGSDAYTPRQGYVNCMNMGCVHFAIGVPTEQWMSRPIERKLEETIEQLLLQLPKSENEEEQQPDEEDE